MCPKNLKIINGFDNNCEFYNSDNIFDIEKYLNYIWFLSDIVLFKYSMSSIIANSQIRKVKNKYSEILTFLFSVWWDMLLRLFGWEHL